MRLQEDASPSGSRSALAWLAALGATVLLCPTSWAQPVPPAKAVEKKVDAAAAGAAQPAPAGAPAGPAPAAPAANAQGGASNFLSFCFWASPPFFILMSAISIYLVSLVIDQYRKLRIQLIIPPDLITEVDAFLTEKKYEDAYKMIRADKSLFARAVTAGVDRLTHGFDRGMDAMIGVSEDGKMEMEHQANYVAIIGQIAPLLGLLGTVLGMILSFQTLAQAAGQPKPAELANNIGLALVSTLEGLIVAIPALLFFGIFRNKIARLIFEVEAIGEDYLWRFSTALKKK